MAVVNETLARQLFGELSAVGRRFTLVAEPDAPIEIVGVVRDARLHGPRQKPPPAFYQPAAQVPATVLRQIEVRAHGDPAPLTGSVRRALAEVAPSLMVATVRTGQAQHERALTRERLMATLATIFGAAALFLVAIGLYGAIAQWAVQRTREIGVRMALGATVAGVRWLVMRQVLVLVAVAAAVGVPAAVAAGHLLRSVLFGIEPTDPVTVIGAMVTLLLVAALAAFLPARRASRMVPIAALRCE